MNKKILPLAALVAMAGAANVAQAVNVNDGGLGEALIYPFYSIEGGQDTYINVVNTSSETKALKVRFREAMNTEEVLDFNLYLSPWDHWSGVITAATSGSGAVIRTADTSCTVPNSLAATTEGTVGPDVAFRDTEYAGDSVDGLARTQEGYVEIIEMGVIVDPGAGNLEEAILHTNGLPGDCAAVQAAVLADSLLAGKITAPTGGLYGYGVLIDVAGGTNATYDAVALANWASTPKHFGTGTLAPGLGNADPLYDVFDANRVPATLHSGAFVGLGNGLNAVSATLMHNTLANDYVLEPSINAGTDWVITFPTKRAYVNQGFTGTTLNPAVPPFTAAWDATVSKACEKFGIILYDREERAKDGDIDFSPSTTDVGSLCYEANILTFNQSNVLKPSSRTKLNITTPFNNGWAKIDFSNAAAGTGLATPDRELGPSVAGHVFAGLPFTGFAVQKYVNGTQNGVQSNYDGSVLHKTTILVTP